MPALYMRHVFVLRADGPTGAEAEAEGEAVAAAIARAEAEATVHGYLSRYLSAFQI